MIHIRTTVALLASILTPGLIANGNVQATADSPYHQIAEANIFGLKLPDSLLTARPPPPLPKITLMGIATMVGKRQVLLKVQFPDSLPESAKEASLILAEGQRSYMIEVLAIEEQTGRVRLNVSGTVVVVSFENHSLIPQ